MGESDPSLYLSAVETARRLRARELSARELLEAHLARIGDVNPELNALVSLVPERARARARELDEALARGEPAGPLHGLPVAVKDLELTRGIPTTFGSTVYAGFVPDRSALFVERLEAAGAVILGKSNTPELGAGSQTFNEVYGRTRNPYDPSLTCGGSSGGAAVALASGMVMLADGSDLGGSLRNPASFCNVVGLRPSPGRVPRFPAVDPWNSLNVLGPMGRSVADLALLLSVMAGPDPRDPLAISEPGAPFREPLGTAATDVIRGKTIAWSPDLGTFPVAREVLAVLEPAVTLFEELGARVEHVHPDFENATEIFQILRAHAFALAHAHELEAHREELKDTVVWNIERGLALTEREIAWAERQRGALYERVRAFMERFDLLVLPVTQVLPFPVEQEWVTEIEGVAMDTYIDWMKSCFFVSLTGLPAISVPAGFSASGLPVGLQIVGRYRGERELLELAHAFEARAGARERHPVLPAGKP